MRDPREPGGGPELERGWGTAGQDRQSWAGDPGLEQDGGALAGCWCTVVETCPAPGCVSLLLSSTVNSFLPLPQVRPLEPLLHGWGPEPAAQKALLLGNVSLPRLQPLQGTFRAAGNPHLWERHGAHPAGAGGSGCFPHSLSSPAPHATAGGCLNPEGPRGPSLEDFVPSHFQKREFLPAARSPAAPTATSPQPSMWVPLRHRGPRVSEACPVWSDGMPALGAGGAAYTAWLSGAGVRAT